MISKFWQRDHLGFGLLVGMVVPVITFFILMSINETAMQIWNLPFLLPLDTHFTLSVAANLFFFRQFMVKKMKDKTGRGILLATFIYAIVYLFVFFIFEK
jgi:uncharacterized membrane protein YagU involved in acid resistance